MLEDTLSHRASRGTSRLSQTTGTGPVPGVSRPDVFVGFEAANTAAKREVGLLSVNSGQVPFLPEDDVGKPLQRVISQKRCGLIGTPRCALKEAAGFQGPLQISTTGAVCFTNMPQIAYHNTSALTDHLRERRQAR